MPMKDVSNEEQSNLFLSGSVHKEAIKLTHHDKCKQVWVYKCIFFCERLQNTSLAAPEALAHRLQCRTACKIQNGRHGPMGSGRVSIPRFLGILNKFFDPSSSYMRKGCDGGKKWKMKKKLRK